MRSSIQPLESIVLVLLLTVQCLIAITVRRRWGNKLSTSQGVAYWIAFGVLITVAAVSIVVGLDREFAAFLRPVRTVAYLWLLPCFPAYFVFLLWQFITRRAGIQAQSESRRKLLQTVGTLAVASPFAVEAWGAFVTRTRFQVQEIDFPIQGLHADLAGLRVLQISDVHLSPFLSEREFARAIDAANELRPHVAVMTGDLISSWGDPVDACIAQLSRIKSDAPMLGCLGNHEIYAQVERYTELQAARLGITFLRGTRRELRFGEAILNIAGVDYQPMQLRGRYLRHTGPLIAPGATNILLSHNPDVFREVPQQGWQAMLAGHTHGGQVTVEILNQTLNPARFITPYVSGLYLENGASCYVTRGVGTIGIPARVGAAPEITLLKLRRA